MPGWPPFEVHASGMNRGYEMAPMHAISMHIPDTFGLLQRYEARS